MVMDGNIKNDVNGATPLPQRQQKNNQIGNKNLKQNVKINDAADGPPDKKPRFSGIQNGAGGNPNKGIGGFGKGFGNRNRRGGGAGGGPNRAANQNQQNQQNQQQKQNDVKPLMSIGTSSGGGGANGQEAIKTEPSTPGPQQQQQPQHQQQQSTQHHPQRGGNRGGGGGPGAPGGGHRDRERSRGGRGAGGGGAGGAGGGGGPGMGGGRDITSTYRHDEFHIGQRLRAIQGPTHEIPPIETTEETKFSGRNRLYVGNLTNDINENELREMFKPYGEIGEVFCNAEKNFTFLKVDFHANAEKAKRELDGKMRKGRTLRVRFAPNATILRVKNLTQFVSNELLYKAFEIFGPVERANIVVDDRGKHTGEGIVEFAKKSSANACLRFCGEKCFFLTASLRPCLVEPFELNEDNDGLPDKSINKKAPDFMHERGVGPRFADLGSFEHEYGTRWKQLHELYKSKQDALKRELKMEEEKLEAQMEYARYEHETELLRQELRKRESDNERKKMEWELREKQAEEMRVRDEENLRRQQNEMQSRMMRQEEEMRRRQQENTLFMQAQQLNSMLDQQEGFGGNGGGNGANFDFGGANNSPFEFRGNNGGNGGGSNSISNNQDAFAFEFGANQNQVGGGPNVGNQRGGNNGGNNNNNNNPWERRRRF